MAIHLDEALCPIASPESVCGRRAFRSFLDAYSAVVVIVDVIWNGLLEALRSPRWPKLTRSTCPRNCSGHLCPAVNAHFCTVVPNFRVMEIDIDSVPRRDELFTKAPVVENGKLIVPVRPDWGVDVNEAAVRAHPPKGRS